MARKVGLTLTGDLPEKRVPDYIDAPFDPAVIDTERLISERGPFTCFSINSIDKIAAINTHLGADLLDSIKQGWHLLVDRATLDQQRDLWCILAQLYGTYENGLLELEDTLTKSPLNFGFDIDQAVESFQISRYYEYLTLCWQHQIQARL